MVEYKYAVDKTIRNLGRERIKIANEERKLVDDIKKAARNNQTVMIKIMTNNIVRNRQSQIKFLKMKAQLSAFSLKLTEMSVTQQIATSIEQITMALQ